MKLHCALIMAECKPPPQALRVALPLRIRNTTYATRCDRATHGGFARRFATPNPCAVPRGGGPVSGNAPPLLAPRPSVVQATPSPARAAAATMTAAAAAPRRLRPWLLGAALAVEAVTVGGSVRNGLPLRIH